MAKVKGWILPADEARVSELQYAVEAGALYYVDTFGKPYSPTLQVWLAEHTETVAEVAVSYRNYRLLNSASANWPSAH